MLRGMTADVLSSIIAAVSFALTALYVALARRHKPTWKAGVVMLLACAELTLAHALQGFSSDFATKVFWYKMVYVGFTISPTAFLVLALRYARLGHVLTRRTRLLLSTVPALTAGLILTNEIHGWMWNPASTASIINSMGFLSVAEARIWYWFFVVYSDIAMGLGCFFLVRLLARSKGIYSWQTGAVVMAAILALLGTNLDVFHASPFQPFIATALGLAVGSVTVAFILSLLRWRDVLSVSRGAVFNSIGDGIIVVDEDERMVDMNPAAERWVGKSVSQAIGKPLEQSWPELKSISARDANESSRVTLTRENTLHTLDLRVSAIQDWRGRIVGHVIVLRDITERMRAEEDLRRATEGTHAIFWRANVTQLDDETKGAEGFFWNTRYSNLDAVNKFLPLPDYPSNDLTDRFYFSRLEEDRKAMDRRSADALRRGADGYSQEFRLRDANGNIHWMYEDARIRRLSDTQYEVIGFITDITDRKRTEEALRVSEEKYRTLFETMTQGVVFQSADGRIFGANPAAERILGLSLDQMLGRTSLNPRWRAIHEDGTDFPGETHPAMVAIQTGSAVRNVVMGVFNPESAEYRWININAIPQYRPGEQTPCQVYATFEDITERKRAEQLIQMFNRAALSMQKATGPGEMFVAMSDELKKVGLSCVFFAIDKDRHRLVVKHLSFPTGTVQAIERLLGRRAGSTYFSIDTIDVFRKSVREKQSVFVEKTADIIQQLPGPFNLFATPLIKILRVPKAAVAPLVVDDEVIGLLTVQSDDLRASDVPAITAFAHQLAAAWRQSQLFEQARLEVMARIQVEAEVIQLNQELEQRVIERTAQLEAANKELEAFAYSVSHDLRAPLRAIDGYTRILVEDYEASLDAEGKRVCAVVQDQTRRMGELIDNLLAFSRLGRAEMRTSKINMKTLAHSVFQELSSPEDRERIDFQVAPLPQAMGDPALIRQVWINLLSNAIKFSSQRARAVIQVAGTQTEGETIYTVGDNGVGFNMQYVGKLFGVFQRLHSEEKFSGTGVGLAIVQRIVHRHGGRVWAESQSDKGATFYFALPRKGV